MALNKIITGGQTGVDRAALDVCIKLNFPYGGYCPKGRIAEDGVLHIKYHLNETATSVYSERTRKNVIISDGTLVFLPKNNVLPNDGTKLTLEILQEIGKPFLLIPIKKTSDGVVSKINEFLKMFNVEILNIAGPRSSECSQAYNYTYKTIIKVLTQ